MVEDEHVDEDGDENGDVVDGEGLTRRKINGRVACRARQRHVGGEGLNRHSDDSFFFGNG